MPFEQKYDAAISEAATARVLERQATNPKDRHIFTVVSAEFNVGQRELRDWVAAATPGERPVAKKARPRFSPVVRTTVAPRAELEEVAGVDVETVAVEVVVLPSAPAPSSTAAPAPAPAPASAPAPPPAPMSAPAPAPAPATAPAPARMAATDERLSALATEAADLRRGNDALKDAMRVVLGG